MYIDPKRNIWRIFFFRFVSFEVHFHLEGALKYIALLLKGNRHSRVPLEASNGIRYLYPYGRDAPYAHDTLEIIHRKFFVRLLSDSPISRLSKTPSPAPSHGKFRTIHCNPFCTITAAPTDTHIVWVRLNCAKNVPTQYSNHQHDYTTTSRSAKLFLLSHYYPGRSLLASAHLPRLIERSIFKNHTISFYYSCFVRAGWCSALGAGRIQHASGRSSRPPPPSSNVPIRKS